jgi:hypothetical protein
MIRFKIYATMVAFWPFEDVAALTVWEKEWTGKTLFKACGKSSTHRAVMPSRLI